MQINYDPTYNIAYIQLREKSTEIETIKISDELNIDISPDGKIYGLELMNATEQLGITDKSIFTFINEKNNKIIELPI
ncbi:MAG: DUF2283 domain-containing protein [Patescibacteria group bacterium]|nr:DUF2283 domain-containing protein [Patescibacteria group bacterium]